MCGLVGFWQARHFDPEGAERVAELMARQVASRGPDDWGVWVDTKGGIALGHRRLSIIDLSEAGHQPMVSPSGRFIITFNGEIYNHLELRSELNGRLGQEEFCWRGHSDTETLLAGIDVWGVEKTLKKSAGMFAFAAWDRVDRILYLARDRAGEKPLYYGWQGDVFLFGSQLNALSIHPSFRHEIDRSALALFLRHNYIPAPHSIYTGIHKLLPGTFIALSDGMRSRSGTPEPIPYWRLSDAVVNGLQNPFTGSDAEAVDALDARLRSAVASQMMSDVPLGAFLSGGVDSSTIVSMMQAQSARPVKTFSIGFHESQYNEAENAADVARHLGTAHTELYVTPKTARNVISLLPGLYDEPFADSSQIPTFLVSQLARQQVTVALSGDGGDELFCGYPRYFLTQAMWRNLALIPRVGRRLPRHALRLIPAVAWIGVDHIGQKLGKRPLRDRLTKAAEILGVQDREQLYFQLISDWKSPDQVVIDSSEPPTVLTTRDKWPKTVEFAETMMYLDGMSYLPDEILVKVDRAAMGASLETRVPFLDHRVIEFAWTLPLPLKVRSGQGKWILRQVLHKYVPQELVERPKKGFGIPIDEWLRGPLREWAETLLNKDRLKIEGFFHPEPVLKKFHEHLSGQFRWHACLWNVLMFQAWIDHQCSAASNHSTNFAKPSRIEVRG